MALATDIYFITNVHFSKALTLKDANKTRTDVVSSADEASAKWMITRRGEQYIIQKFENPTYHCWCRAQPEDKERVECLTTSSPKEWIIKRVPADGSYTISPSDNANLFWGIEDNSNGTTVELSSRPSSPSHHWRIHRAPLIAETIVESTKIEFEWMDTTNDPFDAQLPGKLENDSLPKDSYISFPKPLEMIWNGTLVGEARISGEFRPAGYQVNRAEHNAQLVPGATGLITRFIQSIIRERSINVDIVTDEVNVYASGQEYKNVKVDFRKTFSIEGFNYFKDNIIIHSIKVVGSDPGGGGVTAVNKIEIRNPTNIAVRVDDIPVEIYYKTEKIGNLNLPPFKLHRKSTGTVDFLQDVHTQFRPDDPKNSECQQFIKDYITSDRSLTVSYNLTGTVIRLGATRTVSIPPFRVESSFKGINKQFVKGITAHISIARTPINKRVSFEFEFENPIHTSLKILAFEGEVKRKNKLFCVARANNVKDMTVEADRTSPSPLFKGGSVKLRRHEMLKMLGRGSLKVTVKVVKATVHIGEFELPDLQFELRDPIRAKLKWNLF